MDPILQQACRASQMYGRIASVIGHLNIISSMKTMQSFTNQKQEQQASSAHFRCLQFYLLVLVCSVSPLTQWLSAQKKLLSKNYWCKYFEYHFIVIKRFYETSI